MEEALATQGFESPRLQNSPPCLKLGEAFNPPIGDGGLGEAVLPPRSEIPF
jgi:hypothetical protein